MAKLLKNNLKNIYKTVVTKYGASWTGEYVAELKEIEKKYRELVVKEAKYDCNSDLANEDFLYSWFKRNIENGEWNANWQILKYFMLNMKIKAIQYMYGEWKFTQNDKEMYDYYNTVEVNAQTKCKPNLLRINSGIEPSLDNVLFQFNRDKYTIQYLVEIKDYGGEIRKEKMFSAIWMSYCNWFMCISNLARNAKMLDKTLHCDNFFDFKFEPINICGSDIVSKRPIEADEKVMSSYEQAVLEAEKFKQFNAGIMEVLNTNKEYIKLSKQIAKIASKVTSDYINTHRKEYEALSPKNKDFIKTAYSI